MSSSTSPTVVSQLHIDDIPDKPLAGYACQNVLSTNKVNAMEQVFYMDVLSSSTTVSQQQFTYTIPTIQQGLVQAIATRYQISSGIRCQELPVDGSTWLVEFRIQPNDWKVVDTFNGCRSQELKDSMDADTQECNFYEVTLRGSYVGTTNGFSDVINFLQRTVDGQTLVNDLNNANSGGDGSSSSSTLYATKFLGVPQAQVEIDDPLFSGQGDEGRDNLNEPTNLETVQTAPPSSSDRRTITIVGGLLVSAFVIAFCGILFILWRRRQAYLQSTRHMEFTNDGGGGSSSDYPLDKFSVAGGGSDPDLEPYNTSNTDEEEDEMEPPHGSGSSPQQHHHQNPDMSRDSSVYISKEDDVPPIDGSAVLPAAAAGTGADDLPSPTEDDQSGGGTMQFDLGNSFKDQLMGLHGSGRPGNHPSSTAKRGGMLSSLSAHGLFRHHSGQSLDGDSDADSWAQTDGTIGSLELQLEPITAEV